MYGVTRVFSQQYQFFYGTQPRGYFLMGLADVNVMHTKLRRETIMFNMLGTVGLLDEMPDKVSPRKYLPLPWVLM